MRFSLVLWLAWRDWAGEWLTSLCLAIGVAAAVAPLLMLFAVRSGVISGMREELQRDPSSRELQTLGQPSVTWALTEDLARRPDVGFVKPTTRLLSATGVLRRPDDLLGGIAVDLVHGQTEITSSKEVKRVDGSVDSRAHDFFFIVFKIVENIGRKIAACTVAGPLDSEP